MQVVVVNPKLDSLWLDIMPETQEEQNLGMSLYRINQIKGKAIDAVWDEIDAQGLSWDFADWEIYLKPNGDRIAAQVIYAPRASIGRVAA